MPSVPLRRKPKPVGGAAGAPGSAPGLLFGLSCQLNGSVTSHSRGPSRLTSGSVVVLGSSPWWPLRQSTVGTATTTQPCGLGSGSPSPFVQQLTQGPTAP